MLLFEQYRTLGIISSLRDELFLLIIWWIKWNFHCGTVIWLKTLVTHDLVEPHTHTRTPKITTKPKERRWSRNRSGDERKRVYFQFFSPLRSGHLVRPLNFWGLDFDLTCWSEKLLGQWILHLMNTSVDCWLLSSYHHRRGGCTCRRSDA
jgi:hypothetical protein